MTKETITRVKIVADEGKILTNGNTYGKVILLAENQNSDEFYEITLEEYNRITQENEEAEDGYE